MKYLIGNHKMNMDYASLKEYFFELAKLAETTENQVGVCVPYVYLDLANKMLKETNVMFGVQNMHHENSGAFTGEVSANMLNDFDCELVVLGHSERRSIFGESNDFINKKVIKAIESGITPIFCIGETQSERDQNLTNKVLAEQLELGLKNVLLEDAKNIIFAYEPVWAIGTGVSATAEDAETTIKFIKQELNKLYNTEFNFVVLYGGSLNAKNVDEILAKDCIDGGLIGGASLSIEKFKPLIDYGKNA